MRDAWCLVTLSDIGYIFYPTSPHSLSLPQQKLIRKKMRQYMFTMWLATIVVTDGGCANAPPLSFYKELGLKVEDERSGKTCTMFSKVAEGNYGTVSSCAKGEGKLTCRAGTMLRVCAYAAHRGERARGALYCTLSLFLTAHFVLLWRMFCGHPLYTQYVVTHTAHCLVILAV